MSNATRKDLTPVFDNQYQTEIGDLVDELFPLQRTPDQYQPFDPFGEPIHDPFEGNPFGPPGGGLPSYPTNPCL